MGITSHIPFYLTIFAGSKKTTYRDMNEITNRIKEVAKEHGTTITKVAEQMGIMQQAISRKINNPRITLEDLEKIAGIIGCKVTDFMEEQHNTIVCPHCGKPIRFSKEE